MKPYAKELMAKEPVFRDVASLRQTVWINNRYLPFDMVDAVCQLVVSDDDIRDAEDRFRRFAPYIRKCFPETAPTNGLIQSPLTEIETMRRRLETAHDASIPGRLFLKRDSELAIAGSVKARGGIYEVLKHAEDIALAAGLVKPGDSYERFADAACRELFRRHTIQVGSTGNLGLSIGIMSAHLGFNVKVHMSADAKGWKKELLRERGAEVIEYEDDYHRAVAEGRRMSETDPASYFVDDEFSRPLFLGYAAAAGELRSQLDAAGVHPRRRGQRPRRHLLRTEADIQGQRPCLFRRADAVSVRPSRLRVRPVRRGERVGFRHIGHVGGGRACVRQSVRAGDET